VPDQQLLGSLPADVLLHLATGLAGAPCPALGAGGTAADFSSTNLLAADGAHYCGALTTCTGYPLLLPAGSGSAGEEAVKGGVVSSASLGDHTTACHLLSRGL
jgi:hypothetical protein